MRIAEGLCAAVKDLVQARWNGWDLAGHASNRRGPINRETYRVQALRADGGLDVAPLLGRGPDGNVLCDRMVLPARYIAEQLTLGYASTVHAAQGITVDISRAVITQRTALAALYVALTRGRDSNLARVVTTAGVDDPARGSERNELHRDPLAVLAGLLSDREPLEARSATTIAADSAQLAGSAQTAGERLAEAAQLAATARTVDWLDQLTIDGLLSPDQRARIAAEDGAASLARVLRRAELAGEDPRQLLHDAAGRGTAAWDGSWDELATNST